MHCCIDTDSQRRPQQAAPFTASPSTSPLNNAVNVLRSSVAESVRNVPKVTTVSPPLHEQCMFVFVASVVAFRMCF